MISKTIKLNQAKQHAFTLIELMIAMVAIVLLISVFLPMLSQQKYDTQYRAASEVLSSKKNDVIKYAYRYDNFWGLPDAELTPSQMKQYFGINDTDTLVNMGPIGGLRESLNTFKVYQYVDTEAFFGSEDAPELLAMAVHITTEGQFQFEYNYYHSDYGWDYAAGAEYVDFDGLVNEYQDTKS